MGVQVIGTYLGEAGKTHEFEVEIAGGAGGRSAVVFVEAMVASTNTADFALEVGGAGADGQALVWERLAGETLEGTNRRYRGGVWAAAAVMAFVGLVEEAEPVRPRRELTVVVRELGAGETHEVRYVRPEELVMQEGGPDGSPGGIDWERTRYVAHGFVIEADAG